MNSTDQAQAEIPTEEPIVEAPAPAEAPAEPLDDAANPQAAKARKEAAGYRERLRGAETQRDTATTQLEALQRQVIDLQVSAAGLKPAAFWASGAALADLLTEAGTINSESVIVASDEARLRLGIPRFSGTADGGANKSDAPKASGPESWSTLLHQ